MGEPIDDSLRESIRARLREGRLPAVTASTWAGHAPGIVYNAGLDPNPAAVTTADIEAWQREEVASPGVRTIAELSALLARLWVDPDGRLRGLLHETATDRLLPVLGQVEPTLGFEPRTCCLRSRSA